MIIKMMEIIIKIMEIIIKIMMEMIIKIMEMIIKIMEIIIKIIIKIMEIIIKIMVKMIIRIILNVMMVMIYLEMDALIIILNKIGIALLEFNLSIQYVRDVIQIVYFVHLTLIVNYAMMDITTIMVIVYNVNHNVRLVIYYHPIVLNVQTSLKIQLMEYVKNANLGII